MVTVAPVLMLIAVWVYALIFVFASLWFSHLLLGGLSRQRISNVKEGP
jgi:hypothetical protein